MSKQRVSFSIIFNIFFLVLYTFLKLVWNWGKIDIMNILEYGVFALCIITTIFSKIYIDGRIKEKNAILGIVQSGVNELIIMITVVLNLVLERFVDDIKIMISYGLIVVFIILSWNILIIYINSSYNEQDNK